ncbi:13795_t:CDS:2 [Cetraspora pellucida]|uniref:13795_t:CDS:1 n=1 Tax=Cetraspora pellucida TaxID=1433469 RepID=A0A9N9CU34_9GLOM|nr:13795_t:CDS:2 [Cetraspora pellucida]
MVVDGLTTVIDIITQNEIKNRIEFPFGEEEKPMSQKDVTTSHDENIAVLRIYIN